MIKYFIIIDSSGMPGPFISQLGTTRDVFVILLLTAAAVKELT